MTDYLIIGADYDDTYLAHYGVVGMRWHHRKAAKYAAKLQNSSSYNKSVKYTKKIQKHLNKNVKNNKKHNGIYGRKYEYLSDGDLKRSYAEYSNNESHKKSTKRSVAKTALKVGAITAGATFAGIMATKAAKNHSLKNKFDYNADAAKTARDAVNSVNQTAKSVKEKVDNARATAASHHTASASSAQTTADRLRAYQEAANRASGATDRARATAFNAHSSRTTTNRSQAPKPKSNRNTVNNTQNTQSAADRIKAYQEAINRASGAADNARNKAYNAGKKKRK